MVKKQLIIDKSLELFTKQGIEATSVQQITDLCGISKGAFYLTFKSKDELIMAIIDDFMMGIISEIDYTVRHCETEENMLYEFYYTTFHSFSEHSHFAQIFFKEHSITFNQDMIKKLTDYDNRVNQSILSMLQKLYGHQIQETMYDLLICIKGFLRNYAELSIHYQMDFNLDLFAKSLVEKTNILAKHISIPFVSESMFQTIHQPQDQSSTQINEQIIALIEQEMPDMKDPMELESLQILKETLLNREPPRLAVIKGLLHNLKDNPHCKWISYLIREYYTLQ